MGSVSLLVTMRDTPLHVSMHDTRSSPRGKRILKKRYIKTEFQKRDVKHYIKSRIPTFRRTLLHSPPKRWYPVTAQKTSTWVFTLWKHVSQQTLSWCHATEQGAQYSCHRPSPPNPYLSYLWM